MADLALVNCNALQAQEQDEHLEPGIGGRDSAFFTHMGTNALDRSPAQACAVVVCAVVVSVWFAIIAVCGSTTVVPP